MFTLDLFYAGLLEMYIHYENEKKIKDRLDLLEMINCCMCLHKKARPRWFYRNNIVISVFPIQLWSSEPDGSSSLMEFEWARYLSFQTFPDESPALPSKLARAGFYFTGPGDTVKCFSCHFAHRNWKPADSPYDIHRDASPACRFLLHGNGNIPIHEDEHCLVDDTTESILHDEQLCVPITERCHDLDANIERTLISVRTGSGTDDSEIQDLALKEDSYCKSVHFNTFSDRLASFRNWTYSDMQYPHRLAEAGFFFIGKLYLN